MKSFTCLYRSLLVPGHMPLFDVIRVGHDVTSVEYTKRGKMFKFTYNLWIKG